MCQGLYEDNSLKLRNKNIEMVKEIVTCTAKRMIAIIWLKIIANKVTSCMLNKLNIKVIINEIIKIKIIVRIARNVNNLFFKTALYDPFKTFIGSFVLDKKSIGYL